MSLLHSPLVIASHNGGKVLEIRELLAPLGITVVSAATLGLPEPEETGDSFVANAMLKSKSAALLTGNIALADDSGLCVPALDGAPGIYSARWAGESKDFNRAMARLQQELLDKCGKAEGQPAYFICVLSLTAPDEKTMTFEGTVQGTLTFPPRGEKGFGYDPVFIAEGLHTTFAEMEPSAKHAISHRARAFEKFVAYLQKVKAGEAA